MSDSFNVTNWGSINADAGPIPVRFTWGAGLGAQAQWSQAVPQSSGAHLITTDYEIDLDGSTFTYAFQLTNVGGSPTSYTLSGGSVG